MKVNVGSGRERFLGWLNLDLEPGTEYGGRVVDIAPDVVGSADSLPFADESLEAIRTRDLLMDYKAEFGGSIQRLCKEFWRVLKPGGKWIAIEVGPFSLACRKYFSVESSRLGGKIPYMEGEADTEEEGRYVVTVYSKRRVGEEQKF